MSNDCIFCKIANGEIPSEKIFEDDRVVAFKDINPAAPVHLLIIPKLHISTMNDIDESHNELLGHIMHTCKILAEKMGVHESGFRTIVNCNSDAGQEVFHLHVHLLGGKPLGKMG